MTVPPTTPSTATTRPPNKGGVASRGVVGTEVRSARFESWLPHRSVARTANRYEVPSVSPMTSCDKDEVEKFAAAKLKGVVPRATYTEYVTGGLGSEAAAQLRRTAPPVPRSRAAWIPPNVGGDRDGAEPAREGTDGGSDREEDLEGTAPRVIVDLPARIRLHVKERARQNAALVGGQEVQHVTELRPGHPVGGVRPREAGSPRIECGGDHP